jgi:hypothetical protein
LLIGKAGECISLIPDLAQFCWSRIGNDVMRHFRFGESLVKMWRLTCMYRIESDSADYQFTCIPLHSTWRLVCRQKSH